MISAYLFAKIVGVRESGWDCIESRQILLDLLFSVSNMKHMAPAVCPLPSFLVLSPGELVC